MAPRGRPTRLNPDTTPPTTVTQPKCTTTQLVTEANFTALINHGPRPAQAARECSYSEFLKCKPLDFKGTEGVVGLTRWFEKMELVFRLAIAQQLVSPPSEVAPALTWAAPEESDGDCKYGQRGEIKEDSKLKCGTLRKEKGSMMNLSRTIKTNKIGGRTQARPMLQAMVTGSHTKGLSLYVPSVMAIMKQVLVHLGAVTAIGLAIRKGLLSEGVFRLEMRGQTQTSSLRVKDFPYVFPEDFPGLPSDRQVEFQMIGTGDAPGRVIYSKIIDLRSGYPNEVRDSRHLEDCLKNRYGHYEFQVMPFGLTNAPAVFMDLMTMSVQTLLENLFLSLFDDYFDLFQEQARARRASEDNIRVVEERGVECKIFQVRILIPKVQFLSSRD
ncbi:hypothetical protein Tco_1030704 [Tanacetum coccineum]|uniref:Reverse transcriptase domain-containing protein n=1 Tax=Tanacetum coccineum TaxID=301880 RepID=A0ABQ5G836_9ASTR